MSSNYYANSGGKFNKLYITGTLNKPSLLNGDDLLAQIVANKTAIDNGGGGGDVSSKADLNSPTFTGTVSGITKTMIGLGSIDNTADSAKPVSTVQQTALNLKATIASPTFTGTPSAPTAETGVNTDQVATTKFVNNRVGELINGAPEALDTLKEIADKLAVNGSVHDTLTSVLAEKATIASPTFTGTVGGITKNMATLQIAWRGPPQHARKPQCGSSYIKKKKKKKKIFFF